MTLLKSDLSESHRAIPAEYRRNGYLNNGWDKLIRWDGRSGSTVEAGISGPSQEEDSWTPSPTTAAGDTSIGLHVVRYRYLDSSTGYVSNPSEEREIEVSSGGEALTFPISTSGAANIIRSTDTKVDRIVVEMSVVGGSEFFKAAEVPQDDSSVTVDISDAELENRFLAWPDDGMDKPPVAALIVSHRERLWLFGQVVHTTGTASFTNGSADVDEGSTDPDWRESALGTSTVDPDVQWFIQKDGDDTVYEIDYYDSGNTKLVLKENYGGTTESDASYKIFSRANVIWVSRAGFPEGFQPLRFLNGPNGEGAGDITAGIGYSNSMLFFTQSTMLKLSWESGPLTDPVQTPLSAKYGALNQRVVIEVEGTVYALDHHGVQAWRGVFPQHISRPVDAVFDDLVDFDQAANFHTIWLPEIRAIRWFVCYSGETYPKHYVQYDVDTGQWGTGEYLQGISDSRLVPTASGLRPVLGDENGHLWFGETGTADGPTSSLSHLTYVDSGSTSTILKVSESLPTTNVGLAGSFLHRRDSSGNGESKLITSNANNSITIESAFSEALTDGEELWVGPIPTLLRTKAFRAPRLGQKKRTGYLWLSFVPSTSTRYLQLRVYEDYSTTAKAWASSRNNLPGSVWPGSNSRYPSTDWLIDLGQEDGHCEIPIGSEWRRTFELEFEIVEPDADFELLDLEHDGQVLGDEE